MKILALERETAGTTDGQFVPHLKAEALGAWEPRQAGVIRELYFRAGHRENPGRPRSR